MNEKHYLPRKCLACGYDLFGLGEEPRCPECGLLNIPDGLRKQVWDLVDSGKWFFSSPLNPFRRRLPGWWWALDRLDDVRRSWRYAAVNVILTAMIIFGGVVTRGSAKVLITEHITAVDVDAPDGSVWSADHSLIFRPFAATYDSYEHVSYSDDLTRQEVYKPGRIRRTSISYKAIFSPNAEAIHLGLQVTAWVILAWAVPAFLGICSQIRARLPKFARAKRTLLAAANYESHRLPYLAFMVVSCLAIEFALQINGIHGTQTWRYRSIVVALVLLSVIYGAMGWVGPLRSDYTKQLFQSRGHVLRILLMYAILFPFAMALLFNELPAFAWVYL